VGDHEGAVTEAVTALQLAWRDFLAAHDLTVPRLQAALPPAMAGPAEVAALQTYLDEGPVAVQLVARHVHGAGPLDILEVGSGMGIVARFLVSLGHRVVATEPAIEGFERMAHFTASVDAVAGEPTAPGTLRRLSLGVDDLAAAGLGPFDLVFSANVLEHVPDPGRAIVSLAGLLRPGGVQAHVCPNYAFPYEPHIQRPLLPFVPAATRWFLPRRLTESTEFSSVNFITARTVTRAARDAGLAPEFEPGVLREAFDRFVADPTFAARHAGIGSAVAVVRALRLDRLAGRLPASLASPMRFRIPA